MSTVLITNENNLGIITLNNPLIHNALKTSDVKIIKQTLLKWLDYNLDAILITGTGKSFCSGLFLDEFDNKKWDNNPITSICEYIENCKCPVICALNGGVFGGAVEISLSCDFRVADNTLSLMVPASRLGVHYEPSGLKRSLNILGPSITRRLFLLGDLIKLEDIIKTQFIDFWVEKDETVIAKAKKLVLALRNNSPLAVGGMKRTIKELLDNTLDMKAAEKRIENCFNSADHAEALLARKQKRLPNFKGL